MSELATLRWDDDTFYFVSDDGNHFYEVNARPAVDADLDALRPLGVIDERTLQISFARRWLDFQAQRPGATLVFETLK